MPWPEQGERVTVKRFSIARGDNLDNNHEPLTHRKALACNRPRMTQVDFYGSNAGARHRCTTSMARLRQSLLQLLALEGHGKRQPLPRNGRIAMAPALITKAKST